MKTFSVLISALTLMASAQVLAFAKAPARDDSTPKQDPRQEISQLILQYNQRDFTTKISMAEYNNAYYDGFKAATATMVSQGLYSFCSDARSIIPQGAICDQMIHVASSTLRDEDVDQVCSIFGDCGYQNVVLHITLTFSLTPMGEQVLNRALYFDSSQSAVDYNVHAISSALRALKLLPSQRKVLDGFWTAVDNFNAAIDAEKAKAAAGQPAKPLTHRDFAAQADLVVSYYRYLQKDFGELAQFGSATGGIDKDNAAAVQVISQAITNLVNAYGLETDMMQKQAADYGRIFVDRANTFSQTLTEYERQTYIRPLLLLLGSKIIPVSESYGDVAIHDAVVEFKGLWEDPAFQKFLQDKLSASDDRTNTLILNLSNLAYKIGQAANVRINVIDPNSIQGN